MEDGIAMARKETNDWRDENGVSGLPFVQILFGLIAADGIDQTMRDLMKLFVCVRWLYG